MNNSCALAAILAVALLPNVARAAAHVDITDTVAIAEMQNGALVVKPLGGLTKPGERLRYTILAKNSGDRPAAGLAPMTKIPAGERYIGGTAGNLAEFSIDGGKTWSRQPVVRVTNPGGTVTQRPALPAEFNAIRWLAPDPLAPGAHRSFTYDVSVE